MPCTLQVDFTGLCLSVEHSDGKQVAVLQPDCRVSQVVSARHVDGTVGVPHIGYLRMDLANLDLGGLSGSIPPATDGSPPYEVIYRFDREEMSFDPPPAEESITGGVKLPRFEEIANEPNTGSSIASPSAPAPRLELLPNLFSSDAASPPPLALLMRTILRGGDLGSGVNDEEWKFSSLLRRPDTSGYRGRFKSVTTWTRAFPTDGVTLVISSFDGSTSVSIPLKPTVPGGVITLKVANLCAENPLEWEEVEPRLVMGDDHDFKWLYRLLQPARGAAWEELLLGCALPFPQQPGSRPMGMQDCFGGVTGGNTFP